MTDLAITHYRFRLVRRGWARGEAGKRVLAAARGRLPSAIAERIAEVWPQAAGDATEPVRVKLRVRLAELADACTSDAKLAALVARLMPAAVEHEQSVGPGLERETSAHAYVASRLSDHVDAAGERIHHDPELAIASVLLDWHTRGELPAMLASFDESALQAWHDSLLANAHEEAAVIAGLELRARVVAYSSTLDGSRASTLRARILAAVGAMAHVQRRHVPKGLRDVLDATFPLMPTAPQQRRHQARAHEEAQTAPAPPPDLLHSQPNTRGTYAVASKGDRSVSCVLPFLLLQPLLRIGYFDALQAALSAAGKLDLLPAFATALAYKVLAPPERGWRRAPQVVADATTFAGSTDSVAEAALTALAADAPMWTSPLDAVIARAVLAGHAPDAPLLLVAHGREHLLVDPDGLFPIAWNERIVEVLAGCTAPIIVSAAAGDRLKDLANHRLITDAPPTRGEQWSRIPHSRLWTSYPSAGVASTAIFDLVEDVVLLARELESRPSAMFDRIGTLDRALGLAAGVALGDIAFRLWRRHGQTSPVHTLQRFSDLSGHMRQTSDGWKLALSLGARYLDLDRARLLGQSTVPWLGAVSLGGV